LPGPLATPVRSAQNETPAGVNEQGTGQGVPAEQHAMNHSLSVDQADLDFFFNRAEAQDGRDENALRRMSRARSHPRPPPDPRPQLRDALSLTAAQHDVEGNESVGQLANVFHV
jgi:hypothetical protein